MDPLGCGDDQVDVPLTINTSTNFMVEEKNQSHDTDEVVIIIALVHCIRLSLFPHVASR